MKMVNGVPYDPGGAHPWSKYVSYKTVSLSDLATMIATAGDPEALAEVHARPLFTRNGHTSVRLVEFVDQLCANEHGADSVAVDKAYDLTVDKFSRLDGSFSSDVQRFRCPDRRYEGMDCRRYFQAFVDYLARKSRELTRLTHLERETFEAKALQTLVRRHFRLSLLECKRSAFMSRYIWRLPAGSLRLLMPRSINGKQRRIWLETNIPDVDPRRGGERARVQTIIDSKVGQPCPFGFADERHSEVDTIFSSPTPVPGDDIMEISIDGLAATVACEKADSCCKQRPAIRSLGPEALYEMILEIFEDIENGQYKPSAIALRCGLSKSALSRFAGTRWSKARRKMRPAIPDLWRNTAKVIGSDSQFVEAAKQAGVWKQVEAVCDADLCT